MLSERSSRCRAHVLHIPRNIDERLLNWFEPVSLVRIFDSPYELAKEFEPTAVTISSWVKQADLDEGRRSDGLTTDERNELARLRRDLRQAPAA